MFKPGDLPRVFAVPPGTDFPKALVQGLRTRCADQPPEALERGSKPVGEIPSDIAFELSKLDPGESSVALTRNNGQTLLFVMMCGRTAVANEDIGREEVAASLRTARLNAIADSFLEQLRADARIQIQ